MKDFASLINPDRVERILKQLEKNSEAINDPKLKKQFWWEQICRSLFEEEWKEDKNKIFKKVLGQTHNFTLQEIKTIFEQAIRWRKNPPALFWKLVREKQREIKEILK